MAMQPCHAHHMIADEVLFIDAEALVLNKPAGLAVHPGPRTPHSLEALAGELRFGFQREPQAVHRLDRDTSGCLLMARNPKALRRLSAAFEQGLVEKCYWAVLDGSPQGDAGVIDLPLLKVSSKAEGWRIVADGKGKPARTRWQVLQRAGGRVLVAFMPETGRTHQIRVHAASGLGVPIAGDPVYGKGPGRMLLHARRLVVPRGEGRTVIDVTAPLPLPFVSAGFADEVDDAA